MTKKGGLRKQVGETDYTPVVGKAVVDSVRGGMPLKFAAQFHRLPPRTVEGWVYQGENDAKSMFRAFAMEVRQAQAEFVAECIEGIKEAGFKDAKQWTALMTMLERFYPEDFRRPTERSENLHLHGFIDGRINELMEEGRIVYSGS